MPFEVYKPRSKGEEKEPKLIVSLSKNSIVLTKPVREKLQHPEYLELAYDNESATIRIRPSTEDQGMPIKNTKISAKSFYDHFNVSTYGKFLADYNTEENALYVSL
jgi:uncharacterized protein YtpQ (UPF0354 family)